MNIKVVFVVFLLGSYSCSNLSNKTGRTIGESDYYVNVILYSHLDSLPFSGKIRNEGERSYGEKEFKDGVPVNAWYEKDRSGYIVQAGTYINPEKLSKKTKKIINSDVVLIDHWHEGDLKEDEFPEWLSLLVIREDSFFQGSDEQLDSVITEMAPHICDDLKDVKYNSMSIGFANSVRDWTFFYSRRIEVNQGGYVLGRKSKTY